MRDLAGWADQLDAKFSDGQQQQHGSTRYSAAEVVSAFRLSRLLRNTGCVRLALERATALQGPDFLQQELRRSSRDVPSRTTLQRAEVSIDVALLLMKRDENEQGGEAMLRWAWADSSPQLGHDWSVMRQQSMPASSVWQALQAFAKLAQDRPRHMADLDRQAQQQDRTMKRLGFEADVEADLSSSESSSDMAMVGDTVGLNSVERESLCRLLNTLLRRWALGIDGCRR